MSLENSFKKREKAKDETPEGSQRANKKKIAFKRTKLQSGEQLR